MSTSQFSLVGLGGTFDHFHAGHRHFLRFASELSNRLMIGVTHPQLSHHKLLPQLIEPYQLREKNVRSFCRGQGIDVETIQISDVYGPTLSNSKIEALAVTEETVRGAEQINQARRGASLAELPIFICDMWRDQEGRVLHSDRIRAGKVTRQGTVFSLGMRNGSTLTPAQRQQLRQPLGRLVDEPSPSVVMTVVIGDTSLARFRQQSWPYHLGVYDGQELQQDSAQQDLEMVQPDYQLRNPAGQISAELWRWFDGLELWRPMFDDRPKHLLIDGEEDLVTAAAVLSSPLKTHVYYGQPQQGLVEARVTEELKEHVLSILNSADE